MRREWRDAGQSTRRIGGGTRRASAAGSSGRSILPVAAAQANSRGESSARRSTQRHVRSRRGRATRCSATGGLAGAAGEAAVEVKLRASPDLGAFQHLLDQVDPAARAVKLVAQELVGRAGRRAEAAVHAAAQDRLGLAALGSVPNEVGEMRFHLRNPGRGARG